MPRATAGKRNEAPVREEHGVRYGQGFVEHYALIEWPRSRELVVTHSVDDAVPASGSTSSPAPSQPEMIEAALFGHLPPGVVRIQRAPDPSASRAARGPR